MDNIIFEKIWQEDNLIELKISAESKFALAYQSCYIQEEDLKKISLKLCDFSKKYDDVCYVEFGEKEGNYTPAFSMRILPADILGHVKIEVDVEIADNNTRAHRCCFFVNSELGLIEQFSISLIDLIVKDIGYKVCLCK